MDNHEREFEKKHGGDGTTIVVDNKLDIFDPLFIATNAINNKNRLKILFIIADENKKYDSADLYAVNIRNILYSRYNVNIAQAAVGNFLKQLVKANLLKKEKIKISGKAPLDVYHINPMGLNRIFLELENLRQELMDVTDNLEHDFFERENQCLITVIDGVDAGKSFLLNCDKDEEVRIGRISNVSIDDPNYKKDILLSNEYEAVTKVSKPHAFFKFKDGKWFIHDGDNTNGTYINNLFLDVQYKHLNNKDVIKLAQGDQGVSLLCSLN